MPGSAGTPAASTLVSMFAGRYGFESTRSDHLFRLTLPIRTPATSTTPPRTSGFFTARENASGGGLLRWLGEMQRNLTQTRLHGDP
jgi:hypothetical protein